MYDLPAFIEYIAKVTDKTENEIAFVGHSMGSTSGLVYASNRKEHAGKYLKGMILLAPVVYMQNIRGVPRFMAPFYKPVKVSSCSFTVSLNFLPYMKTIVEQI